MKSIIFNCLIILLSLSFACSQEKETVTEADNSANMDEMWGEKDTSTQNINNKKAKLFDEGNFGMFIHWGLYSNLAGVWKDKTYYGIGEWIMNPRVADIPAAEYMKISSDFNPQNFDAKGIAQLAKDAGMKYIIITSKHHDGFAMFDSEASDFNIVDATPFARDPMKELSTACHELGLGFGFYYSHNQDWTSPGATGGPKVDDIEFKDYFYSKCKPQVREICTNYGDIDFVWFDTPGDMKKEYVIELADMVRELQPDAMMCSRVGHGMGDYSSNGDMQVPTKNIEGLWETCDTNNDSWSYAWYDNNFKSPKEILSRLISTVGRGGTYLFNVGPGPDGAIPEIGVKFLKDAGHWIDKYPQVIYDAGSSPWKHALPWGDVTTQGNSLFLSIFEWPQDGKLYLPGLDAKITSASVLSENDSKEISFTKNNNWTTFELPSQPSDSPVSVIEVKLESETEHVQVDTTLGVYSNIETLFRVEFAEVTGAVEKEIKWMEKFGEWKHVNQVSEWTDNGQVTWTLNVQESGFYYLDLNYKGNDRLVWRTTTDEGIMVQNQQAATEKYQYYNMGIIEFKTPGKHTITVSLVEGDPATSSLKAVLIKPIQ